MRSYLLSWARNAALLVAVVTAVDAPQLLQAERIRENHATAVGVITKKTCEDHGRFYYTFVVADETHRGVASGFCEPSRIGDPNVIHYQKGNPDNNIDADPVTALVSKFVFMVFVALIVPPILIAVRKWHPRRAGGSL